MPPQKGDKCTFERVKVLKYSQQIQFLGEQNNVSYGH